MMYITNTATPTVLAGIKNNVISSTSAFEPFKVGLSESQKSGIRTMAAGREGLVRLINRIAQAHVQSLARELDPVAFDAKINYDNELGKIEVDLLKLLESLQETRLANSADIMKLNKQFSDNLQSSRQGNASLDLAMREVDEWNSRFGRNTDTPTDTPTPTDGTTPL